MSRPVTIVLDAVKALKIKGYKTAVLTNNFFLDPTRSRSVLPIDTSMFDLVGDCLLLTILPCCNLRTSFQLFQVVESCRVGLRKPDKAIYRLTLEKLQCKPEESVLLDDIGDNVKSARDMGMKTIKVRIGGGGWE